MSIWVLLAIGLVLLFVILLLIVLSSMITMSFGIRLSTKECKVNIRITMLFGLLRREYDIPVKVANGAVELEIKEVPDKEEQDEDGDEPAKSIPMSFPLRGLNGGLTKSPSFKRWMKRTLTRIRLKELKWTTRVALDNAAETAVATGLMWSIKHTLLGWVSYKLKMEQIPQLDISPIFNGPPQISTEMRCIAEISCGKAMYAGLVLMVRVLKMKGGIKSWQNTQFKA